MALTGFCASPYAAAACSICLWRGEQRRKEMVIEKQKRQLGRRAVWGINSLTSWSHSWGESFMLTETWHALRKQNKTSYNVCNVASPPQVVFSNLLPQLGTTYLHSCLWWPHCKRSGLSFEDIQFYSLSSWLVGFIHFQYAGSFHRVNVFLKHSGFLL